jgi:DNA-binding FadR family transcriptional regulator
MRLGKIRRIDNLYEEVVRQVKKAIMRGEYCAGEPLPGEHDLGRRLGVSRPVVREALRTLQTQGFVEIRRGIKGGAYVREPDGLAFSENLCDLIRLRRVTVDHLGQARLFLEPEVCRLAALNGSERDLEALHALLEEYETTASVNRKVSLNVRFHRDLSKASGNPFYAILMESIMGFTEDFIRTIKPLDEIIHKEGEHRRILSAVAAHEAERAEALMRSHVLDILSEMRRLEKTWLRLSEEAGK